MKINNFLLQYREMPHVIKGDGFVYSFLKRHIRTKTDLIVPRITNFVHNKQNTRNFKIKKLKSGRKKLNSRREMVTL